MAGVKVLKRDCNAFTYC